MHRIASLIVAALMATACATRAPVSDADQRAALEPLLCTGASQCAMLWRAAHVWVIGASGFKIQIATDAIIQTYSPPDYSMRWGPLPGAADLSGVALANA